MWRASQRTMTRQEDEEIDIEAEGNMDRVAQEIELLEAQGIVGEL